MSFMIVNTKELFDLKSEIAELKQDLLRLKNEVRTNSFSQVVYRQYRMTGLPYDPIETIEYTSNELVDAFLKHTGMILSKSTEPAKTVVTFSKGTKK